MCCSNQLLAHATELLLLVTVTLGCREVDENNTHCDYTFEFVVHVHGFDIDVLRISIFLVLVCIFSSLFCTLFRDE